MKRVFFSIADQNNLKHYVKLEKSFKHFHPNEELRLFDEVQVKASGDPDFYYRAKPAIAKTLFEEGYDEVIGMDADQIILGDLSPIWDFEGDVGVVLNDPSYPIRVWDCLTYYNNGLVVLKSEAFVDHWLKLCYSPHFKNYQFREQDLLSLLTSDYFNYRVHCLDTKEAIYGEWAKPLWAKAYLKDKKVFIPTEYGEKQLSVIHFGGGTGNAEKGNYRIRFQPEVVKYIDKLV